MKKLICEFPNVRLTLLTDPVCLIPEVRYETYYVYESEKMLSCESVSGGGLESLAKKKGFKLPKKLSTPGETRFIRSVSFLGISVYFYYQARKNFLKKYAGYTVLDYE